MNGTTCFTPEMYIFITFSFCSWQHGLFSINWFVSYPTYTLNFSLIHHCQWQPIRHTCESLTQLCRVEPHIYRKKSGNKQRCRKLSWILWYYRTAVSGSSVKTHVCRETYGTHVVFTLRQIFQLLKLHDVILFIRRRQFPSQWWINIENYKIKK